MLKHLPELRAVTEGCSFALKYSAGLLRWRGKLTGARHPSCCYHQLTTVEQVQLTTSPLT